MLVLIRQCIKSQLFSACDKVRFSLFPPSSIVSKTSEGMAASAPQVFQGSFLIGLVINIFLHGLATTQVYLYLTIYKKDRFWLKSLIVILYLVDTFNCVVSIYYIYDALVTNFGDEANLTSGSWAFAAGTVSTGAVSVAVQHFFSWRVYMLTNNAFIMVAIVLCSLANLAGSLGVAVGLAISPGDFRHSDLQIEITVWLVGAVLADTIIAVSLGWHLGRHKHLYPALNSIINRILRMTVQTGVVTTIVAIINLACYLTDNLNTYMVFSIIVSKLYLNCMLSTLNARGTWRYDGSSEDGISHVRSSHPEVIVFQAQSTQSEVSVHVESHEMTDTDDKSSHSKRYI